MMEFINHSPSENSFQLLISFTEFNSNKRLSGNGVRLTYLHGQSHDWQCSAGKYNGGVWYTRAPDEGVLLRHAHLSVINMARIGLQVLARGPPCASPAPCRTGSHHKQ